MSDLGDMQLHWIVPGSLDQRTGGYIYDRRIVDGLRAQGAEIEVHELEGRFPDADGEATLAAKTALERIGQDLTVIDGLALPAFIDQIDHLPKSWLGLIHHPLSMETGLSGEEIVRFADIESRLMHRASKLVVTSPGTARDLRGFDLNPAEITIIIPGVQRARPARRLGAVSGGGAFGKPSNLLTVGSLTRRKGHLTLLAALGDLTDLDWRLALVGSASWDPAHADEIERAITDLGLAERVTLTGELDEAGLASHYHEADLFVLASHHEGYGMVLTEAIARGLPIVSTTAGAIPETVPDAAGFLVPPGDSEALAAALREVLSDRDIYGRLAKGAADARRSLQTWDEAASQFSKVLHEMSAS